VIEQWQGAIYDVRDEPYVNFGVPGRAIFVYSNALSPIVCGVEGVVNRIIGVYGPPVGDNTLTVESWTYTQP
jgi:hypothetical protein